MEYKFIVVMQQHPEWGYIATVPAISGCCARADSLEELRDRVKEVIQIWLEVDPNYCYIEPFEPVSCEIISA